MDIATMRQWVRSAYPLSTSWREKVNKMSDKQIIAVYHKLIKQKKIKGA